MKKYLLSFLLFFTFGTLFAQTYQMKVVKKGGEIVQIPADDIERISFEASNAPQPATQYVTLFGVKWATGNLQYDKGTWKIADHQWDYFKPRYGLHRNASEAYKFEIEQADDQIDHFNFGVCGSNALTYSKDVYGNTTKTDIAGKMYTDDKFLNKTTDFEQAAFGDIAYWATKGKYRLPRYAEISDLVQKGKWQFGYVIVDDNKRIYGYLVTEPGEGEFAMTIRAPKEITQDDLSKGLFLPCAGSRYDDTKAVKYAGYGGYYTSSILFEDSKDYARSLSFDNDGVYDNNGENCRNGNSIRPVVVE